MPAGRTKFSLATILIVPWLAHAARAENLWPEAVVGVIASDNIGRSDAQPYSDTVGVARVGLTYIQTTGKFQADVDGEFTHQQFLRNSFPNDNLGQVRGVAALQLVPDILSWSLEEDYGQIAVDPFEAVRPGGFQNINYVTTGPTAGINFNARDRLEVLGEFSSVTLESSNTDNNRIAGQLKLIRDMGLGQQLSAQAYQGRVLYRGNLYADYDIRNGSFTYVNEGARSSLTAEAGYSQVYNSTGTDSSALIDLRLVRHITPRLLLDFGVHSGMSNTADSFRLNQIGSGPDVTYQDVIVQADPFREIQGSLGLSYEYHRNQFTAEATYERDRYVVTAADDRDTVSGQLTWLRHISAVSSLRFFADYAVQRQLTGGTTIRDVDGGASYIRELTAHLRLEVDAEHYGRSSDTPGTSFPENRLTVALYYAPRGTPSRIDARGLPQRPRLNGFRPPGATAAPGTLPGGG